MALRRRLRLLAVMPLAGRLLPDLASGPGLRFWSMPPYLVAYLAVRRPLVVVRILHGSRAPADLRDELADG